MLAEVEQIFHRAQRLGIILEAQGDQLIYQPASKTPPDLVDELREHKTEILAHLRPMGDGQAPPLDRPPETNQELRRLIDHLADTEKFTQWLEWAMKYADPSEASQ